MNVPQPPMERAEFIEDAFVNFARPEHFTYPLPDKRNTVIELELHDESDRS